MSRFRIAGARAVTLLAALVLAAALSGVRSAHPADAEKAEEAIRRGDFAAALEDLRPLAEQGHVVAQTLLGVLYRDGKGVPQDDKAAAKWFRIAAEQGFHVAQHSLGVMYMDGRGVDADHGEAAKWLRPAAAQGDADAQVNLALIYLKGDGLDVAHQVAGAVSEVAADLIAKYVEEFGDGILQDFGKVRKWAGLAAGQGHPNAQAILGSLYEEGMGVPQDHGEAARWYELAAEQGHPVARERLGQLHRKGKQERGDR